jgi:hypothetical protein
LTTTDPASSFGSDGGADSSKASAAENAIITKNAAERRQTREERADGLKLHWVEQGQHTVIVA